MIARLEGFDSASKEVEKVANAQGKATEGTKAAKPPIEELNEQQEKLNASGETYSSLLGRLHPLLGAFADSGIKAVKVVGDLANKHIDLRETVRRATTAIRNNVGALKGLAGMGFVVAVIATIAGVFKRLKQEAEAAASAIRQSINALNELKREEAERQQEIERVSDLRRGGGYDAATARRVAQDAEAVSRQYEAPDPDTINQIAGSIGDKLTRQQLATAAFLTQTGRMPGIEPGLPLDRIVQIFNRLEDRFATEIAGFFERERAQGQGFGVRGERAEQARTEAVTTGGATVNLEAITKQFLPAGADAARIVQLAQTFGNLQALREWQEGNVDPVTGRKRLATKVDIPLPFIGVSAGTIQERGSPVELAQVAVVLKALEQRVNEMTEAVGELKDAAKEMRQQGPLATEIRQYNGRYYGPDAASRRRRTVNGEGRARLAEML